jgi:hypothetical protein
LTPISGFACSPSPPGFNTYSNPVIASEDFPPGPLLHHLGDGAETHARFTDLGVMPTRRPPNLWLALILIRA